MNTENLRKTIEKFQIRGNVESVEKFGSGHIHDTYLVKNCLPGGEDYILQRINTSIFKEVDMLMNNMVVVTDFLKAKLSQMPDSNPDKEVLTIIPAVDGKSYIVEADGSCWRVFLFLRDTRSYDLVETETQAYQGGVGYGRFYALLSDLDASQLGEVLPGFHCIGNRHNQLQDAISKNSADRVKDVEVELNAILSRVPAMSKIREMGLSGALPLRTTHNDTKFNNVLLDANDLAQCVIDLDTIMPGYVAYDFGDAIRTIVNSAEEDEKELDKIQVNMKFFEAFARGFIKAASGNLTREEADSLADGCLLLPYIMGMRFLTDYINGDVYYKINFPEHNLQRARAQIRLVEKLEEQYDSMKRIIMDAYSENLSAI